MSLRKWLVRLLVFGLLGSCGCALALYHQWTDPATVRKLVIEKLNAQLPGAVATLDSASLRLLGGIQLRELRLIRRDDPEGDDFAYIPSAILYHDKEHLLNGKLALRKVELHKPRLRVIRDAEGRWNLSGLAPPARQETGPLPVLVITQGTFLLEDRQEASSLPPLEITDINLTVMNDPLTQIAFEGRGRSTTIGDVALKGVWRRDTGEIELQKVEALGLPITPDLVRRLAAKAPPDLCNGLLVEGLADLHARVGYFPSDATPLRYELDLTLKNANVQHPRLPMALDRLAAQIQVANGKITVKKLSARAGCATIEAVGEGKLPHPEHNFQGVLIARKLPVTRELALRIDDLTRKVYEMYQPIGLCDATFQLCCQEGKWREKSCVLEGSGLTMRFDKFPYPAQDLAGKVTHDFLTKLTTVDITGTNGKEPLTCKGYWRGDGVDSDGHVVVTGTRVPIDERAFAAMAPYPAVLKIARSFNPAGRVSVHAEIKHKAGVPDLPCTFLVQFHDAALRWDGCPYPAEKINGQLNIYPRYWEVKNLHGTHNGGELWIDGKCALRKDNEPQGTETTINLNIRGQNIAIDDDLRKALAPFPGMGKVWDVFEPAGFLSFNTHVERLPGQTQEIDVAVNVDGCAVKPKFIPYQFADLGGHFRFRKNRLELTNLTASHGASRFSLAKGIVDIYPGGGFYADLDEIRVNPLLLDKDLMNALPDSLRSTCEKLDLKHPVAIKTRAVISQSGDPGSLPDCYWDGQLFLKDASVRLGVELDDVQGMIACVGRHNGRRLLGLQGNVLLDRATLLKQPFQNVHSKFQISQHAPDILLVGLRAPIFGGEVSGEGRVEFGPTLRYELNMTAAQVQLEQFGRHNLGPKQDMRGVAAARLYLSGQGYGTDKLEGNGRIDVPYGSNTRLYNLPLLLDLLNFLGLRWPDHTAFDEMHAVFGIHGNRVNIRELDLQGNVISLTGRGEVNLDGSNTQLDFYPSWAAMEQIMPGPAKAIPPAISQSLLKIEMRGKIGGAPGELQFHKIPLPGVVDPVLQLRDRMAGKRN